MSKDLAIENNRILLNPRHPGKFFCLVCTALYLLAVAGSVAIAVPPIAHGHFPFSSLAALLFWSVVWAILMRNYNCRIVFDGDNRKVYRRTALGEKELMDFSNVGSIIPVSQTSQGCDAGTYYALTPKGDLYGRGIRITPDLYDRKLAAFKTQSLPELFSLLESRGPAAAREDEPSAHASRVSGLAADIHYFRRDGDRFVRFSLFRMTMLAAIFAAALAIAAANPENRGAVLMVAGVVAVLSFLAPIKLILDSDGRTVTQVRGWGLLKRVYPYDHFSHFNATRQTVNFFPVGTRFSMVMQDPAKPGKEKKIQLAYGYSTKRFDRIAAEIQMAMGKAVDAGARESGINRRPGTALLGAAR